MKRIVKSAVVLGVVSLASFATLNAQAPGRASFHLGGGIVLPTGDFGDGAKTGFQGMGGVSFGLAALPFAIRVDGFYGQNSGDSAVVGPDVKAKFFGGMGGAQFNLGSGPSPVKPYILGQVGMVNGKVTAPGFESESNTDFAFAAGAGIQFGLGSMSAFVEGKYLSISTEGGSTAMMPVIFGLRFGGN
jgi:opacity protein-like surface antigen